MASSRAYFEQQRESLVGEIAMSFEQVLANINKLNRNLEAVIAVGNEFSSVEALWSTFEGVMGKEEEGEEGEGEGGQTGEDEGDDNNDINNNNNNNNINNKDADVRTKIEVEDEDEDEQDQMDVDHDGDVEMG